MPPKRRLSSSPSSASSHIYRSTPILDRSSRFIAVYSPNLSVQELQNSDDFKTASHRIAAWRKPSSQRALSSQQLVEAAHDDDGEKYGGKTLEKVLIELNIQGAVVVARWYGGVMLGPVRFDHIKKCAREAITHFIDDHQDMAKKAKVDDDLKRRTELLRILPERDQSISVLRDLLAEKQGLAGSQKAGRNSSAKVPEYSILPLPTLENLERARDATLGWILEHIEKAEAALEAISANKEPATEPAEEKEHAYQKGSDTSGKPETASIAPQ